MIFRTLAALSVVGATALSVSAQDSQLPGFFQSVTATVAPTKLVPGSTATLTVTVKLTEGFHIYSPQPGDEYAIPTSLVLTKAPGVVYGKPVWPKSTKIEKTNVYEGTATITVPVTIAKSAKGSIKVGGVLKAQGCNATGCLPPASVPVSAVLTVGGK